ncbi:SHOCT domain-containing protein [Streptomyces sp. NRRL F-2664]|uniref:SHOCT domain-containing protein n=1 Tax=Streptomyces sp. NRRL F-2664 TaxID=1463842 RepID=UPI0004CC4B3B|nr:SHOCT domain-containing protein [Streptomyces sp. NRRL F-2664]
MFIRPRGVTVRPADRPAGSPLLRGLLARASGTAQDTTGAVRPELPRHRGPRTRAPEREPEPTEEPEPYPADEPDPMDDPSLMDEPDLMDEPEPIDARYWDTEPHPEPGPAPPTGLAAELRQLADLAREGMLTPQEFTAAKARLLNG